MKEDIDETAVEDLDGEDVGDLESAAEDIDGSAEFWPGFPGPPLPFPFPFGNGGRAPSPQTARGQNYFSAPPGYFATQSQVRSLARKVENDMRRNAAAIRTVNNRVARIESATARQSREMVRLNREMVRQNRVNVTQGRQIEGLRRDIKKASDMNLMLFLLNQPTTIGPTTAVQDFGGIQVPAQTRLVTQSGTGLNPLLLAVLFGGFGGDSGGESINPVILLAASGAL